MKRREIDIDGQYDEILLWGAIIMRESRTIPQ